MVARMIALRAFRELWARFMHTMVASFILALLLKFIYPPSEIIVLLIMQRSTMAELVRTLSPARATVAAEEETI